MCEKTEDSYLDGEVVWVKLGSCFWPGEVVGPEKLPPDLLPSFRKPPIAVVQFFQEDTYEYVKNPNSIFKYNCSRKNEFINKGLYMYRTKHGHMEKFPEDVIRAETAVGGDIEILTRDEFQEKKKESYAGIFGDSAKKTPGTGKGKRGRPSESQRVSTPFRRGKEKVDYKVHILVQGSKSTPTSENTPAEGSTSPTTSVEPTSDNKQEESQETNLEEKAESKEKVVTPFSTPTASSSGIYACHACQFTTTRLNVLILHNKSHSVSFMPYTPSPVRKKPTPSQTTPVRRKTATETQPRSSLTKTPKVKGRPRKEKSEVPKKTYINKKRAAEEETNNVETKKVKTDEEIKSSLLADWDDGDDESNDESTTMVMAGSPEVPEAAKSPAVPTSAELSSAPTELSSPNDKKSNNSPAREKPESSSDSKYEFCEDEDWPVEAGVGRMIPRVKNKKRKEDTKSISIDEDEVAREVAELLNKTTVPELPSAPEPLKVEENFPEPSIVKSPDKLDKSPDKSEKPPENTTPPTKAIFKTKTFFRSRHSRSQDAIGKYVAEQLNAVERMDIADHDLNGSEVASSPEARESPPIEHVKVARLAPKIQLKKMKAEAAQLREREKFNYEQFGDAPDLNQLGDVAVTNTPNLSKGSHNIQLNKTKPSKDVLYPTQEIKPVNTDSSDQVKPVSNMTINIVNTTTKEGKAISEPETTLIDNIANSAPIIKFPETSIHKSYQQSMGPYMNESTASAVDALLSVSRDTDRVTKVISDDPPEDLFEDDNKDSSATSNDLNGFSVTVELETAANNELVETEREKSLEKDNELISNLNEFANDVSEKTEFTNTGNVIQEAENFIADSENVISHSENVIKELNETSNEISNEPKEECSETNNISSEHIDKATISDELPAEVNERPLESNETSIETNQLSSASNEPYKHETITQEVMETDSENVTTEAENIPSESDLQIAETLINLPATAIQNNTSNDFQVEHYNLSLSNENSQDTATTSSESMVLDTMDDKSQELIVKEAPIIPQSKSLLISNNENINVRFETEQEKSENLNAAQSLVQMSESIDHKMNIDHNLTPNSLNNNKEISDKGAFNANQNNGLDNTVEQKLALMSNDNCNDNANIKSVKLDTTSSKLLKILEEPSIPKHITNKSTTKQIITAKEKILNFDVARTFKGKSDSPKQKIIIRRTTPSKTVINNINDVTPEKIILSRSLNPAQDGSVQTYTIQTSPEAPTDANTIIFQQKLRKIAKQPTTKLQKIKPQTSLITPVTDAAKIMNEATSDDAMFDINSMPIVLSEDLQLTPENIEKMPIVMSDGNIIPHTPNPPKLVKTKLPIETEKVVISPSPSKSSDVKTLLMNPISEVNKATTPNILSKSSKLRGGKPMLVIDKTTGKQKIIMTKEPTVKELKQPPTLIQTVPQNTGKGEKFIILPTTNAPRPGRTQKIVIDPQTGKAHVLLSKGSETQIGASENKSVSAKLLPTASDASTPGNTVMIITNAQGAQSRIVLTPEHEKMLFPKKQQPNLSQLKTITHRISTNPAVAPKSLMTTIAPGKTQTIAPVKTQTRIVPKQKSTIITSKGQLIVGGRVATTSQNIAPMPEIRPVPKRIMASEPKKLVQTIQKNSSEPLIFLQQKSGAVMQLTTAQFEHLQRTGQIVQKTAVPVPEKVVQKTLAITPNEVPAPVTPKPRIRKTIAESATSAKKFKQEIAIAPAPAPMSPMPPALTPLSNSAPAPVPSASKTNAYSEFENFEELLPSTAIVKQQQEPVPPPPPAPEPAPAPLSDGQLLAVPGEHFGGPPGSFYLCVEDNGTLTPIDNRPLVLENNQLVPMAVEPLPVLATQPERRDILEAALANSDVFNADTARDEAPDFRDLNANVSVHCRVSETSTTLNQPIMTPVEMPSKADSEPTIPSNLEDGLAVIGVTTPTVPTSLELPITVTDPRIAPAKTTDPLSNNNYGAGGVLLPSPNTEMTFVTTEEVDVPIGGPISMPLLTDDESVGKSMPILTDEVTERTVSSVESTVGSPSSIDVRESETEDGGQWSRRLLTPNSDTSEASAEIPLQPAIQLSVNELSRHS